MRTAFCFDLDGTVTTQELLPLIAAEAGINEEIALLTSLTIKGIIPFETSFKLRVKLLGSIAISRVRDIVASVKLQQRIAQFILNNRANCYVVTGNLDVWIEKLACRMKCRSFSSQALYDGDTLNGIKTILDKGNTVKALRKNYDRIVAVGDGMNDASMLEEADIAIAYGGVHPPVETLIKISSYVTYDAVGLCNILNTL